MNKSLNILISLILTVSGCASYQKHPDFTEKHKKIYTAAVMPAEVEIYKLNFKGDKDPMYDLMAKAVNFSKDEVENTLLSKNYTVQKLKLDDEILVNNPELKTALFNVKKLFNQKLKEIQKRKEKKFTYSLGSDINQFADMADADVLVFIKESGFKKTGGEIAKDIAKSVLFSAALAAVGGIGYMYISPNEAVIQIAIVDSNTGDILWYNYNRDNPGIDLGNERSVRSILKALLSPFPQRATQERKIVDNKIIIIPQDVIAASLDSVEEQVTTNEKPTTEVLPAPVENYRNIIIERIKTQLPPNFTPLSQPVWLRISVLKSGAIKELGVLKDKSNPDKEIQRVALKSLDKALPMPTFPEDISDKELNLDIQIQ
ncbi:MAG: hypothetical protein AB1755_00020 [Candidatus Omnitrophota bacterium]